MNVDVILASIPGDGDRVGLHPREMAIAVPLAYAQKPAFNIAETKRKAEGFAVPLLVEIIDDVRHAVLAYFSIGKNV